MADKKDFIVRAGLTVSTNASVNTALSVGNSTVNVVINSTAFSGTANNASYLGGNTASDLQTYADNKSANAYANAVSYTDTNFVNTSNFSSNLANYQTTAGLASNVAGLTANNATHLGGVNSAIFVQNTDSRTLSGNLTFSGANVVFTTAAYVGANTFANTEGFFVGNSTVNAAVIPGSISINGAVLAGNVYVANTYAPLASPTFTGTVTAANITSNVISANATTTNNITVNANLTVRSIVANGSLGTANQVLTTDGANVYWSTVTGGGGGGGTAYNSIYLQYTGNGTNTVYSVPGGYAANNLAVYINGALLRNGSDVNVSSGSSITFTEAPPNGSLIDIIGQSTIYANGVSSVVSQQFTANGTANSFIVSGGYLPNTAIVFLNGVKQIPGTDVITTSGNTVNFVITPANGYVVDVYGYQAAIVQSTSALTVGNTVIGLNQISVGNSSVNTQIVAGNVYLNGSTLVIGNSSSNVVINDNSIRIGTQTINSTAISVNAIATNTFTIGTSAYFISNGNVGIGTNSPSAKLTINGAVQFGQSGTATNNWHLTTEAGDGNLNLWNGNYGAGTFRFAIASNGNIGIGTNTPTAKLDLYTASGTIYQFIRSAGSTGSDAAYYRATAGSSSIYNIVYGTGVGYTYSDTTNQYWVGTSAAAPLILYTNNTERMRIDSAGQIVTNGVTVRGRSTLYWDSSAEQGLVIMTTSSTYNGSPIVFYNGGAGLSGFIGQSGSAVTYNSSSDYRLKENIRPLENSLSKVLKLNPVSYNWKIDGIASQGFLAHEVQEIIPEAITGEKDALNEDGTIKSQSIDIMKLIPLLTAAIQELNVKVDAMQAELNILRGQ